MTRPASPALSASVAVLALIAGPARAEQPGSDRPAGSPEVVFGAAVDDLRSVVLERCAPAIALGPAEKLGIGLKPGVVLPSLAPDQNSNLMLQLDDALKHMNMQAGINYVPTYSLDAYIESLPSRDDRRKVREEQQRRTHVLVQPVLLRDEEGFRFSLRAEPAGKFSSALDCLIDSRRYPVPKEVVGEPFYSPGELFRRFAARIYDRISRSRNELAVVVSDRKLEPLADDAVSTILKAIDEQKSGNLAIGAEQTAVEVRRGESPAGSSGAIFWRVELKLIAQQREAKLTITATPSDPTVQGVSENGLVRLASLPALNASALQQVSLGARTATASLAASILPVSDDLQRLSGRTAPHSSSAFAFTLDGPRVLEVDVEQDRRWEIALATTWAIRSRPPSSAWAARTCAATHCPAEASS